MTGFWGVGLSPLALGGVGVEVEGELVSGELAGGDGAAYVQGLGGPAGQQGLGAAGQGVVEVEGIGEVELALDAAGALEGDLLVVDGEVPALGRGACICQRLFGHVPGDRLGDQPFQGGDTDLVREPSHLGIHEPVRPPG